MEQVGHPVQARSLDAGWRFKRPPSGVPFKSGHIWCSLLAFDCGSI
jgi:hypothetical protein